MNRKRFSFSIILLIAVLFSLTSCRSKALPSVSSNFDGSHAYRYAESLMAFGPRIPGSSASKETVDYIRTEMNKFGWQVEVQQFEHEGVVLNNLVAHQNSNPPDVLIGAHYDTRLISDQESDPALQSLPVPGANDGTSGTAVLMELARSLEGQDINVWLVFFDGEDQGRINNWDWSVGAQYFADNLAATPKSVIVIDMIGDQDLNIYREKQSDQDLCGQIWNSAEELGLSDKFINKEKYAMLDDHLPFVQLGIPSCLLIDFDYPYWHTQSDVLEHISSESLQAVGDVLLKWLSAYSD
ncbi:M28 family peptidase [Pelolinea submarina]|uniref:Peptidase M28-like protein n=1 Tax=Pelolinea submarina TaxID=913107 RepID=A0A3E0AGK4_9CHLR|nr:M28 family peptidase [Pelolinea submarina]REG10819.1 peptidase M28-like protein [Pelolinea submarina]